MEDTDDEKCVNCGDPVNEKNKCNCETGPKCVNCCNCKEEGCEGNCKAKSKENQEG